MGKFKVIHGMFGTPEYKAWATHSEQNLNKRTPKNNTSGYKGVYKRGNKWEVYIFKDKMRLYIGKFENLEDAITKRKESELKHL